MEYYTYPQAPRLTKYLHLKTLDEKGVFVFYSHTPLMAKVRRMQKPFLTLKRKTFSDM